MKPPRTTLARATAWSSAALVLVGAALLGNAVRAHHSSRAGGSGEILGVSLTSSSYPSSKVFYIGGNVSGLSPGVTKQLPLTVSNPNNQDLQVNTLSVSVGSTSNALCPGSNLQVTNFTGPPVFVAKNNGSATINVPITMKSTAPSQCQNVQFNLQYSGTGSQAVTGIIEGNVTCASSPAYPPDGRVVTGNLTVPSGVVCTLDGVQIQGLIQVNSGGTLVGIDAITVSGNLQGTSATKITLDQGTHIGGSLQLSSSGGVRVMADVGGQIQIIGTSGVSAGSPNFLCASSSTGNFLLQSSTSSAPWSIGGTSACGTGNGNSIGGNGQILSNAGAVTVANNQFTGNLQCSGNGAGFSASNNTAKSKSGQCA